MAFLAAAAPEVLAAVEGGEAASAASGTASGLGGENAVKGDIASKSSGGKLDTLGKVVSTGKGFIDGIIGSVSNATNLAKNIATFQDQVNIQHEKSKQEKEKTRNLKFSGKFNRLEAFRNLREQKENEFSKQVGLSGASGQTIYSNSLSDQTKVAASAIGVGAEALGILGGSFKKAFNKVKDKDKPVLPEEDTSAPVVEEDTEPTTTEETPTETTTEGPSESLEEYNDDVKDKANQEERIENTKSIEGERAEEVLKATEEKTNVPAPVIPDEVTEKIIINASATQQEVGGGGGSGTSTQLATKSDIGPELNKNTDIDSPVKKKGPVEKVAEFGMKTQKIFSNLASKVKLKTKKTQEDQKSLLSFEDEPPHSVTELDERQKIASEYIKDPNKSNTKETSFTTEVEIHPDKAQPKPKEDKEQPITVLEDLKPASSYPEEEVKSKPKNTDKEPEPKEPEPKKKHNLSTKNQTPINIEAVPEETGAFSESLGLGVTIGLKDRLEKKEEDRVNAHHKANRARVEKNRKQVPLRQGDKIPNRHQLLTKEEVTEALETPLTSFKGNFPNTKRKKHGEPGAPSVNNAYVTERIKGSKPGEDLYQELHYPETGKVRYVSVNSIDKTPFKGPIYPEDIHREYPAVKPYNRKYPEGLVDTLAGGLRKTDTFNKPAFQQALTAKDKAFRQEQYENNSRINSELAKDRRDPPEYDHAKIIVQHYMDVVRGDVPPTKLYSYINKNLPTFRQAIHKNLAVAQIEPKEQPPYIKPKKRS